MAEGLLLAIGTALALSGCTVARMAGFDALASQADRERIDVTGVPGWANGSFHLGATTGSVRRFAGGEAIGWGPARGFGIDNVQVGAVARFGTIAFALNRPDIGGELEGRCRYSRTEARGRAFGLDLAVPLQPLQLDCVYRLNGRDLGELEIHAVPSSGITGTEPRLGFASVNGIVLDIRSTHELEGSSFKTSEPIGYVLDAPDGLRVAAIELNGVSSRRMLLPPNARDRLPAIAAMLSLALFWDPGNTD